MKKIKIIAVISSLTMMLSSFTGCETVQNMGDITNIPEVSEIDSDIENPSDSDYTSMPVETYPEYPVTYPEIEKLDTGNKYQAEECSYGSTLKLEDKITGFEGDGYITGFNKSNKLEFDIEVPSNQHYDLTFCIASDEETNCHIQINDRNTGQFKTNSEGVFTRITMYGVFLTAGNSKIVISTDGEDIAIDYLEISNNTSLQEIGYNADGELSNSNAGESAKELMQFLTENYGKYVITGQYASDETNKEINLIYSMTGKKPVIRFSALETSSVNYDESFKDIDACADWYRNGGIVGLMWYWKAPGETSSVYADETDFELSNAVTTDIEGLALMPQEDIRALYGEGQLSKECYSIIMDIDNMAGQLMSLKNKGIPVLWRPLHEASGDWFWWGASGADDYRWLWELMYTRMTEYFELDNLIWVWNGQSKEYIVTERMFDIASVDVYISADKEYGSRYEQFASLQDFIGQDKLIALSECSDVPDIDAVFRDNSVWSFFGLWYGNYLMNDDGTLSEEYTTKDELVKNYNSKGAMTLDKYHELTDFVVTTTATTSTANTTTVTTTTTVSSESSTVS